MPMDPTKVPTPPTLFHRILPTLIAFKIRISLILPRDDSAHFVGTVIPLLGGFLGVRAILYKITNMKNPKQTFINHSRWDPLRNAFMMKKLEREATIFRYPIPSSSKIQTIIIYQKPNRSRR